MVDQERSDVLATWADIHQLVTDFDYKPSTPVQTGLNKFMKWFKEYYAIGQVEMSYVNELTK